MRSRAKTSASFSYAELTSLPDSIQYVAIMRPYHNHIHDFCIPASHVCSGLHESSSPPHHGLYLTAQNEPERASMLTVVLQEKILFVTRATAHSRAARTRPTPPATACCFTTILACLDHRQTPSPANPRIYTTPTQESRESAATQRHLPGRRSILSLITRQGSQTPFLAGGTISTSGKSASAITASSLPGNRTTTIRRLPVRLSRQRHHSATRTITKKAFLRILYKSYSIPNSHGRAREG
jgi:hypothetical protein